MWYVRRDYRKGGTGLKMLQKTMELAKAAGATHMVMAHTGSYKEKLAKLYGRLGFEVLETQYIRGLE
jgi:L-amino acid N-acyltransferase YncA